MSMQEVGLGDEDAVDLDMEVKEDKIVSDSEIVNVEGMEGMEGVPIRLLLEVH
jgi:hypothetical protein